jgi:hypothetical protein
VSEERWEEGCMRVYTVQRRWKDGVPEGIWRGWGAGYWRVYTVYRDGWERGRQKVYGEGREDGCQRVYGEGGERGGGAGLQKVYVEGARG